GLNGVPYEAPVRRLENDGVLVLAELDGVTIDDDLRAALAPGAERESFHCVSPPFASMCGHMAARRPSAERQELRMLRTPASMPSRSATFCFRSARMWTHGAEPERWSATICLISVSVSPSRRA